MDNKRFLVFMVVCLAILVGWQFISHFAAERFGWDLNPKQQTQQVETATQPATAANPAAQAGTATAATPAAPAAPAGRAAGGLHVLQTEGASPASLGSAQWKDQTWSMGVDVQPQGAAIARVALNQFPQSLQKQSESYVFQQRPEGGQASMATEFAIVNGQRIELSNVNWKLVEQQPNMAVYAVEIGDEKPALRITKRIEIQQQGSSSSGYEALVRHTLENLSGNPMEVVLGMGGPTTPLREVDRGPDLNVLAGYNDDPQYQGTPRIQAEAHAVESLTGSKQTIQIIESSKGWKMIWAGMTSTYFDALVLPVGKDNLRTAEFLDKVQVKSLHPDDSTKITAEMLFQTKALPLASATPVNLDMQVFFGPKARSILKNDHYGAYPRQYFLSLVTSGTCCFPTAWITPLIDAMVGMLRGFHFVLRDWGLAIIALVFVVRVLMHPLTRKSTISMHKMSKLAPEMERIKKKYADNPEEQQRAMMAFQREYAPGMLLGCLPMVIQMPIWIALWSSLQSTFELRLAPFLWGYTWIDDLARPDHLVKFDHPFSLFFIHIDGINILPILLAVVFYLQQKVQPQQPATTPEQQQQQKMMKWMMVLMFPLMLYSGPAGLNLYILTSTAIGIGESWWIRKHIKAREAAEAVAGPVIIDAPATRGARRRADGREEPEQPKGLLGKWWHQVMTMAEEAQKQKQAQQKQHPQKKDRK